MAVASDTHRTTTGSTAPRVPLADGRAWRDLALVTLVAAATGWRWHWLAWAWGASVVLLFLRAGAIVASARASSNDPEEKLASSVDQTPPHAGARAD
jgi:hypothetical protein